MNEKDNVVLANGVGGGVGGGVGDVHASLDVDGRRGFNCVLDDVNHLSQQATAAKGTSTVVLLQHERSHFTGCILRDYFEKITRSISEFENSERSFQNSNP